MLANLAQTDALTEVLIGKGVVTDAEFKQKLLEERAVYQRILNPDQAMNVFRLSYSPAIHRARLS